MYALHLEKTHSTSVSVLTMLVKEEGKKKNQLNWMFFFLSATHFSSLDMSIVTCIINRLFILNIFLAMLEFS
jgi:hypothetical protein